MVSLVAFASLVIGGQGPCDIFDVSPSVAQNDAVPHASILRAKISRCDVCSLYFFFMFFFSLFFPSPFFSLILLHKGCVSANAVCCSTLDCPRIVRQLRWSTVPGETCFRRHGERYCCLGGRRLCRLKNAGWFLRRHCLPHL